MSVSTITEHAFACKNHDAPYDPFSPLSEARRLLSLSHCSFTRSCRTIKRTFLATLYLPPILNSRSVFCTSHQSPNSSSKDLFQPTYHRTMKLATAITTFSALTFAPHRLTKLASRTG